MSDRELRCEEVIERLFDFLDGELDGDWDADIHIHLERCRDCYSRAEFERRLRAKVSEAATVQAPASLHQRIKGLLDQY